MSGESNVRRFSLLAIGAGGGTTGLLAFALFEASYLRAYADLGVTPDEVGLSTGNVVAHAVGVVNAPLPLLALAFVFGVVIALILIVFWSFFAMLTSRTKVFTGLVALTVMAAAGYGAHAMHTSGAVKEAAHLGIYQRLWKVPDFYVNEIRAGHATRPLKVNGLILFYIRADLARIEPTGEPPKVPAVAGLSGRDLLYLGTSEQISVLYDPLLRESIRVPNATVLIRRREAPQNVSPACTLHPVPKVFGLPVFHLGKQSAC